MQSSLPVKTDTSRNHDDGASAHIAKLAHDWIAANSLVEMNFSYKTRLNSRLQYLEDMFQRYISTQAGVAYIDELKKVLQLILDQLSQDFTGKATLSTPKTSGLCEYWWWTLRTYAEMN